MNKSYQMTRMYRDLKLRAAIIAEKTLTLLPTEQIVTRYPGFWNLSAD